MTTPKLWHFIAALDLIFCATPAMSFLHVPLQLKISEPVYENQGRRWDQDKNRGGGNQIYVEHQDPASGYNQILRNSFLYLTKSPLLRAHGAGRVPTTESLHALDLSAAAKGQTVEEVLLLAQVPRDIVAKALTSFPGLRDCHPHAEVLGRLHHLNFIIEQGVYSFSEALHLIAHQPHFLEMPFSIVYEDDDLVVINKPSDVRMDVPQRKGVQGQRKWPMEFTCSDWLDTPGLIEPPLEKKRFCHNLDSATSGILCVARNQAAAARVVELFSKRMVEKEYLAVVFGHVSSTADSDTLFIDAPIEKDPHSDFRMRIGPEGKSAQTQVEVLERGFLRLQGPHFNAPVSKLRLKPITGRRHQLRVHTMSLGHGIVGDTYVGDWASYRMMLHAHKLGLPMAPDKHLQLVTVDPFQALISPQPLTG